MSLKLELDPKAIQKLHDDGKTFEQIAEFYDCDLKTIQRYATRLKERPTAKPRATKMDDAQLKRAIVAKASGIRAADFLGRFKCGWPTVKKEAQERGIDTLGLK